MIVLFTDFGLHGPYTGQVKAVLHQMAPGVPAIDLFADAHQGVGLPLGGLTFPRSSITLFAERSVGPFWQCHDGAMI
jgi:S-adenosyl-l-methionine hydroxide adenosyltransferase